MKQEPGRILYTACPLCESPEFKPIRNAECCRHPLYNPVIDKTMRWMNCIRCGHIFVNGFFSAETAKVLFARANEHQKVGHDYERKRPVAARMVERVIGDIHTVDYGHWLDIGFGDAALLFTAHEYGYTPVGVEIREQHVVALKAQGIEAHNIHFEFLPHAGRYDVVSMADVLEHIAFPARALRSVHVLLKPFGKLLISMPNIESFAWKKLDATNTNPYWGEIEHYHNFSRTRLYELLKECGFSPLRYYISERYKACMEVVANANPPKGGDAA